MPPNTSVVSIDAQRLLSKLDDIDSKLENIIRVEERIESHEKSISALIRTTNEHTQSIHQLELFKARNESYSKSMYKRIGDNSQENDDLWKQIEGISSSVNSLELDMSNLKTKERTKNEITAPYKDGIGKVAIAVIISVVLTSSYMDKGATKAVLNRDEHKEIKHEVVTNGD